MADTAAHNNTIDVEMDAAPIPMVTTTQSQTMRARAIPSMQEARDRTLYERADVLNRIVCPGFAEAIRKSASGGQGFSSAVFSVDCMEDTVAPLVQMLLAKGYTVPPLKHSPDGKDVAVTAVWVPENPMAPGLYQGTVEDARKYLGLVPGESSNSAGTKRQR